MKEIKTNNGRKGGWLVGKRHYDKDGKPLGGIKAVVTDAGGKPVELEGGEVIINREASKKYWKELSKINQSAGNGVAIGPPSGFDEDPEDNYENGGKIDFNPNHIPNKWILSYAEKIKAKHPEIWKLGGNIFGNEAFNNLKRVAERGHWLDSEEWMYIKWRSYVARHIHDFRIEGVVAMLKWVDKVEKGWPYMKQLIEDKIDKLSKKGWKHKAAKMKDGGSVAQTPAPKKDRIVGSDVNKPKSSASAKSGSSIKFSKELTDTISIKVKEHNSNNPSKKVTLAVAKAVVRRGMGAYSSSHRLTITGGKPNDRTAWGLARLNAFFYKVEHGKSKSGKYTQDDDLIEELGYKVAKYHLGGDMSKHLAPNGKPSNLTPEQYKLVRTPAFKQWFGDWENDPENASKVVDENGEPLVVYHGSKSNENFNVFKQSSRFEFIYFAKTKNYSWLHFTKDLIDKPFQLKPFFLNIRNLLNAEEFGFDKIQFNELKSFFYGIYDLEKDIQLNPKSEYRFWEVIRFSNDIFNSLKEEEYYNGISFYENFYENTTWNDTDDYSLTYVVMNPNQIKLADGSNTTFDGNNPDIRYAEGGELAMGIKAEHEHSKTIDKFKRTGVSDIDIEIAIAKDHLKEDPHYYSKLAKMEGKKYAFGGVLTIGLKGILQGKTNKQIEVVSISNKIVNYLDIESGKKIGLYKDKFIKNFIEKEGSVSTPKTSPSIDDKLQDAIEKFQKNINYVNDLPINLVLRVLENQKAQGNQPTSEIRLDADTSDGNFNWGTSLEGQDFWTNIFEGNWLDAEVMSVMGSKEAFFEAPSKSSSDLEPLSEASEISVQQKETQSHKYEDETEIRSERDLLIDEYNDITFLISITPSTDVDNMLALKQQSKELKDKLDALDLELKKKIDGEINLLENLFKASAVKPQERYELKPYNDGFAPNGQPTELPKHIYDWTMTEEFINWFGNFTTAYNYKNSGYLNTPCSVVVNKNYEPLIVYHGTGSEFSFFKFDKFPAMYFAENVDYANWFAEIKGRETGSNGYIYPFLLNIRTPLDLTYFKIDDVSPQDFIDWMFLQTGLDEDELKINKALLNPNGKYKAWMYMRNSPEMLQVLREKNVCDGIIYYEDNPSVDKTSSAYQTKAYIVFNSNSAKIADPSRDKLTISAMRSFYLKKGGKV